MRIAIVEDEKEARSQLIAFLKAYEKGKQTVQFHMTEFADGADFLAAFKPIYDIVFLDIEMPHSNGMEVARKIRKMDENVVLVFITNMPQYAINGYEVEALDYILKPLRYANFCVKLDRAVFAAEKRRQAVFSFSSGGNQHRISPDRIYYFEVIRHCVILHSMDGDFELWHIPMNRVEEALGDNGFARCSVSYLVNLKYVSSVTKDAVGVGQTMLPLSRGKKKEFLTALSNFMG